MSEISSPANRRRHRGREVVLIDANIDTPNITNAMVLTNVQPFTELSPMNPISPIVSNDGNSSRRISSAPSPDEMIIQARGRKQVPLNFSPDVHHTPIRQKHANFKSAGAVSLETTPASINRLLLLPKRTSPRKRLQLSDSPPKLVSPCSSSSGVGSLFLTPSPEKMNKRSPVSKRNRAQAIDSLMGRDSPKTNSSILMKGLSTAQLIDMLSKLVAAHPELEPEVEEIIPQPDLTPLEEKLLYLKRNIYKSLPNTRLESKTDSMAYNRASTHLLSFKKALQDQAKSLQDSQQWESLVDYCIMAWTYVKATPIWDNLPHNNVRKQCFKTLAGFLSIALKKVRWNIDMASDVKNKLNQMAKDSEDLQGCIKQIDQIINKGNSHIDK